MPTSLAARIAALQAGLLFWYRNGDSGQDWSGNNRTLSPPDEAPGIAEGADGFSDSAMVCSSVASLAGTVSIPASTAYTLAAWVKITGSADDNNEFIRLSDAGGDAVILSSSAIGSLNYTAGNQDEGAEAGNIEAGDWHHVAVTLTTGAAKLYFDGALLLSGSAVGLGVVGPITGISLGGAVTADSLSLKDPAAWSRVLTDGGVTVGQPVDPDSEIGWLWNGGEGFDPTFLPAEIAFVKFPYAGGFLRVLNQSPIDESGRVLNRQLKNLSTALFENSDGSFDLPGRPYYIITGGIGPVFLDSLGAAVLSVTGDAVDDGNIVFNFGGTGLSFFGGSGIRLKGAPLYLNDGSGSGGGLFFMDGVSFEGPCSFSSPSAKLLRPLFDHYTDVSTTSTNGTENDLYSDPLVANIFAANGAKVFVDYGLTAASGATKNARVQSYVAGTSVIDSGTLTFTSAGTVGVQLLIVRESSSVLRVYARMGFTGLTLQPIEKYTRITGLTLTNTQIVKLTGIASGATAASGDIVAKIGVGTGMAAA